MRRKPDNGEVLIEARYFHANCGPESPFILPSEQLSAQSTALKTKPQNHNEQKPTNSK